MKNFLIMTNEEKDPGFSISNKIREYIESKGGAAFLRKDFTEDTQSYSNIPIFPGKWNVSLYSAETEPCCMHPAS